MCFSVRLFLFSVWINTEKLVLIWANIMHVRPTEKLFLMVNPQKNLIFMLFSNGTPSEKYFFMGIQIFLWVFAHTEIFEFRVVIDHVSISNMRL